MTNFRRLLRRWNVRCSTCIRPRALSSMALWVSLSSIAACERSTRTVPIADSTVPMRPAVTGQPAGTAATTWDNRLGPVLLVAGAQPDVATIVLPDSSQGGREALSEREAIAIRSTPAMLLGHSDSVQLAILAEARLTRASSEGEECTGWPTWRLTPGPSGATTAVAPWSIGFVGATAQPVRLDSIENMSSADSARLAAEVTRLASTLPNSGGDRLVGLPFSVISLWRFHSAPGVEGVAASLVRRVNQEARPFEERTLVIAERDSSRRDDRLTLAYFDRAQGAEETVESRDVLAVARMSANAQPMIVVARDFGDGMAYAIVERDPSGRWREKWRSGRGHCK
jgi:hypothetical protein